MGRDTTARNKAGDPERPKGPVLQCQPGGGVLFAFGGHLIGGQKSEFRSQEPGVQGQQEVAEHEIVGKIVCGSQPETKE